MNLSKFGHLCLTKRDSRYNLDLCTLTDPILAAPLVGVLLKCTDRIPINHNSPNSRIYTFNQLCTHEIG